MKKLLIFFLLLSQMVNAQVWVQQGSDIIGEAQFDRFGYSVSTNHWGDVVAVGAPKNDGSGLDAGHVRIYAWDGSNWIQRGNDIDGIASEDQFGHSVSLNPFGNTVVIGAYMNDSIGMEAGQVSVYKWNGSAWIKLGNDLFAEATYDNFGKSVSISQGFNAIIAVGAQLNDGSAQNAGHVRVYQWFGSWNQKGGDIDGESAGDQSGFSVDLSSDGLTLAIGATNNHGSAQLSGHVRVYEWISNAWVQKGIDLDGEDYFDWSGYSVSLSDDGNTVAIGALYNLYNSNITGHVRVYEWNGTAWIQKGNDLDGEGAVDWYGASVSLSDNGNVLAIGGPLNDATAQNSGHTRVFEWDGISWNQISTDITGVLSSELTGQSVSISGNGTKLAVGSPGRNNGRVTVYTLTPCPSSVLADSIWTSDSTEFCQGGSALLQSVVDTNFTKQWLKYGNPINGETGDNLLATKNGNYSLLITDQIGCTYTSNVLKIKKYGRPPANIILNGSVPICVGDSVLLKANSGPYTYQWIRNGKIQLGASDSIFYTKSAGNHKALVTDTNGCFRASNKVSITRYQRVKASINPTGPLTICLMDSVQLSAVITSGTAPFSYQWYRYNTALTGETNTTYFADNFGGYSVLVSDGNACVGKSKKTNLTLDSCIFNSIVLQPDSAVGKDAYVHSINSNTNYGDFKEFSTYAWTVSQVYVAIRSLIEFDLSQIPVNAQIISANLSLYNNPSRPGHSTQGGSNASQLQRVINPWDEHTVTWNNQPIATTIDQITLPASTSPYQDYENIDVKSMVQDMVNNPASNYGFRLKLANENFYRRMIFSSSDFPDSLLHPKLEIAYTYYPPSVLRNQQSKKINRNLIKKIQAYPNPFNETLRVHVSSESKEKISLYLRDALGRTVFTQEVFSNTIQLINTTEFNAGLYLLEVLQGDKVKRLKVFKNH